MFYSRGGQQVDRRVSIGRSRLILHWIDKIPKMNTFQLILLFIAFYDIFYLCLYYRPVDRELSRNFLIDRSRRQRGHPCAIVKKVLATLLKLVGGPSDSAPKALCPICLPLLRLWTAYRTTTNRITANCQQYMQLKTKTPPTGEQHLWSVLVRETICKYASQKLFSGLQLS